MARSRYRSQPALQRSGGRGGVTLLVFSFAMVLAVGAGVLVSTAMRGLDDWANRPSAKVEQVARTKPATPAPASAASIETQGIDVAQQDLAPAPEPITQRTTGRRTPRTVKPVQPLLAEFGAPQRRWEDQQRDYLLARDAYDASERAEGFRWAQQYKVRTQRYCRALERQRTTAFMEGCLNYAAGSRPRQASGGEEGPG